MTGLSRLLHRVEPRLDESVMGYIMRSAYRNHLKSPQELLQAVTGSAIPNMRYQNIPELAYFCKISIDEALQLSGYQRWERSEPHWLINNEWVTKLMFIQPRTSTVCPICIQESPYLRSLWSLTFYQACAEHECQLVTQCPNCHKRLKWDRRRIDYCGCKQYIGAIEPENSTASVLALAKLMAFRTNPQFYQLSDQKTRHATEKLARLSLDGLCKTVWLIGQCLLNLSDCKPGHGRKRPQLNALEIMASETFEVLDRWPSELCKRLDTLVRTRLPPTFTTVSLNQLLRPISNYLNTNAEEDELLFIKHAYEQQLQKLWLSHGKPNRHASYEKQLRLDF